MCRYVMELARRRRAPLARGHAAPTGKLSAPPRGFRLERESSNPTPSSDRDGRGTRLAVDVRTESEQRGGWKYHVRIQQPDGSWREHTVTLCWCDHDYWSGGRQAPSKVLETVLELAVNAPEGPGSALPERFDAARLRRLVPTLDAQLRPRASAA